MKGAPIRFRDMEIRTWRPRWYFTMREPTKTTVNAIKTSVRPKWWSGEVKSRKERRFRPISLHDKPSKTQPKGGGQVLNQSREIDKRVV
jgi:hypothetical protein